MAPLPSPLLADRFAPRYEFGRTDHVIVEADPASAFKAVHDLDLTDLHGFLVTAEMRVVLTDPRAWLSFRRYWRVSTPFVGVISRAILRTVKHSAETGGLR